MPNKRSFLLSLLSLALSFPSCSGRMEPDSLYTSHISICVLGNSYSNDSFCYVPFILKEYGISSDIHIYYRSGGSLENLYDEWSEGSAVHYCIDTRIDKKWKKGESKSAASLLLMKRWDVVSLQQYSKQVCAPSSYYPFLTEIIAQIRNSCQYPLDLAWFMAYNRSDNSDRSTNLSVQNRIVDDNQFDLVFPVATAVFNCQENPILAELGDSQVHLLYSLDGIHLQEGLPCYIAALSICQAIFERFSYSNSVIGDSVRPTQGWIESINGITPNGNSVGVSEENCLLAQKAAILANNHKFEILPIE